MKESLRQSMAWLHGWAGLIAGWILYAVFVTGTLSYFRLEITHWMQPELRDTRVQPDSISLALRELQQRARDSSRWVITTSQAREPALRIGWMAAAEPGKANRVLQRFDSVLLDPTTAEQLQPRATLGGDFFQRFHYELGLQQHWGRWLVGACAMFMLVTLVSGVITHKNLFRNFFTFRPNKGARSWLDAHNVVGALALPYHFMITYTGLIVLMLTYMPAAVEAGYRYDPGAFLIEAFPNPPHSQPAGRIGKLTGLEPLLQQASDRWGGGAPASIVIDHPGDAGARIQMHREPAGHLSSNSQAVIFDGVSGEMLWSTEEQSPTLQTHSVLYGLHQAHFPASTLRWAFALCGLLGTAMVATGLVLWSVKRSSQYEAAERPGFGHRLVQVLNIGTITGLPLGVAAYFWANRLLPADFAERVAWEVRCFFAAWAVSYVVASLLSIREAWRVQLAVGASMFALLPLVNAATTDAHLGITLPRGLLIYAGFDLTMLVIGLLLATAAWHVSQDRTETR